MVLSRPHRDHRNRYSSKMIEKCCCNGPLYVPSSFQAKNQSTSRAIIIVLTQFTRSNKSTGVLVCSTLPRQGRLNYH